MIQNFFTNVFKKNTIQKEYQTPSWKSLSTSNAKLRSKICFGDVVVVKVKVKTKKKTSVTRCVGTVCYIGYPFPASTVRYGINLRNANGDHNGTLNLDRKGRIASKRRGKPRKFFIAKQNHGIIVKQEKIVEIQRSFVHLSKQ